MLHWRREHCEPGIKNKKNMKYKNLPLVFSILLLIPVSMLGITYFVNAEEAIINNITIEDEDTGESLTTTNEVIFTNDYDPGSLLDITKSPNRTAIEIGETVTYTITVTNKEGGGPPDPPTPPDGPPPIGTFALNNIVLTDDFPETFLEPVPGGVTFDTPWNNCEVDAAEIRCNITTLEVGESASITAEFTAISAGTATNTATVTDSDGNTNERSSSVVIGDPGNVFLISKQPDKTIIEVGEEVSYTITIKNRTDAQTINDVNIQDDCPEDELGFVSMESSTGMSCNNDVSKIDCNIQTMGPGDSFTLTTHFTGVSAGTALNTLTVTSGETEPGNVTSTINVVDPVMRSIRMSSNCENRNVLVGQQCLLTAVASYRYAPEKDVSNEVNYFNYQNIGTLTDNILTTTQDGVANITSAFDQVTSNAITIEVISDINSGTDVDGNIIQHFPARIGGGTDTVTYASPIRIGTEDAGFGSLAEFNRLILTGLGGDGTFNWFLEDRSLGTLRDMITNTICSESGNGYNCGDTSSVIFESKENEGNVLLQMSDTDNNMRNLVIHILPPKVNEIRILDEYGDPITGTIDISQEDNVQFTADMVFSDGSIEANKEGELEWEFSHNGAVWTNNSEAGNISSGILKPLKTGTFTLRANFKQDVAYPGQNTITEQSETIISDIITIQIGDPVAFIDSMRTAGNEGLAKGTTDKLYVRLRHFGTFQEIEDVEFNLIRGTYESPEDIPASIQHFDIELVAENIIAQNGNKNTVLLEIPFFIPLLEDIGRGMHTLRIIVHHKNGLPDRNIVTGILPIFIGDPMPGDANLDERIDLVDAVLAMRIISGNETATNLQRLALDYDGEGGITIRDFMSAFQSLLNAFLK